MLPHVHAQDSQTIQIALIGCGGRGSGAAANALSAKDGPVKLVAMADVFENRLEEQLQRPEEAVRTSQVDVPEDRKFIGFDGYKHAMDCLKPGDVAIFTTPLGVSLGAFHLRDRKEAECFHGEAAHRRRPDVRDAC